MRACIQAAGVTSFGALENLANAYSTLYRYLKDNYDDTKKLKKYWGYLTNNVVGSMPFPVEIDSTTNSVIGGTTPRS